MASNTQTQFGNGLLRSGSAEITAGKKITVGPCATQKPKADPDTNATISVNRGSKGVESIEVVCSCGEKIIIRCDYEQ